MSLRNRHLSEYQACNAFLRQDLFRPLDDNYQNMPIVCYCILRLLTTNELNTVLTLELKRLNDHHLQTKFFNGKLNR